MKPQPYLCFNGYELLNALRTLSYMRRGLIDNRWTAAVKSTAAVGSGYSDVYSDIYTSDPYSPGDLVGYCAAIDFSTETASGGYVSPAADDAPWYQASRPDSAEFMGLTLRDLKLSSPLARAVQTSGPVGAALGRISTRQRIVAVTAVMYASSERGMAYGERWLTDVLSGNQCDPVSDLGDLVLLPACNAGFRTLKRAGLIDGPVFSELGRDESVPSCVSQQVDFQFSCELPWLFADATVLASSYFGSSPTLSGLASTDSWVGDAAVRIKLAAFGSGSFSGNISLTPLPSGYSCPTVGLAPAITAVFSSIPPGNILEWDSAARTILEWDAPTKRWVSGFNRIRVLDGFTWLDIPPCSQVCVTIGKDGASPGAAASIEQINREL